MYQDIPTVCHEHPVVQIPQLLPAVAVPVISTNLIPTNYTEGSKIDLAMFCIIHALADSIKKQLQDNMITGSHAFSHMTDADL